MRIFKFFPVNAYHPIFRPFTASLSSNMFHNVNGFGDVGLFSWSSYFFFLLGASGNTLISSLSHTLRSHSETDGPSIKGLIQFNTFTTAHLARSDLNFRTESVCIHVCLHLNWFPVF